MTATAKEILQQELQKQQFSSETEEAEWWEKHQDSLADAFKKDVGLSLRSADE